MITTVTDLFIHSTIDIIIYISIIRFTHSTDMLANNVNTFSPMETPPDVTITSTLSSAERILTSSESGLFH